MRSECGQATIEWTGLLLLIALALVALSHLAPQADGRELGTSLAHSVTATAKKAGRARPTGAREPAPPAADSPAGAAPLPPRLGAGGAVPRSRNLPRMPGSLGRAGRGAGAVWRKAWFACLVYERTRYAFRHPESRIPGYTLPYGTALRMVNNCVSPVDLLRDLPGLDATP
jgi:hypothetical protein